MSIQQYPEYLFELASQGGLVELGDFTCNGYKQLSNVTLTMIFYRTDLFSNQRIRVGVDRTSQPGIIYSDWLTPSNSISGFTTNQHWFGNVRFDFSRQNLQNLDGLTLYLDTENYVYANGGTQLGVILNYLDSSGNIVVNSNQAGNAEIFGYQ